MDKMRINISPEMRSRLQNATANGSVIAGDILAEIAKDCDVSELIRGTYNYFTTKRIKANHNSFHKLRIVFTACGKNLGNENFPDKGNPSAPWFRENRADLEPSTFIGLFRNLREYTPEEKRYFISAITLDSKVSVKIYSGMKDFFESYCEDNYTITSDNGESSLHNSCMRYEDKARNAADFYRNFAGARIMVAKDRECNIIGRAVVWNDVTWETEDGMEVSVSLMDRIYTSHTFVTDLMRAAAQKAGIIFRKQHNDYSHQKEVIVLNSPDGVDGIMPGEVLSVNLRLEVPVCQWHKRGVPYLDTFSYLMLAGDVLELRNHYNHNQIAGCHSTSGYAARHKYVCPRCNRIHDSPAEKFCAHCRPEIYTDTVFGRTLNSRAVTYKGAQYPSSLFKRGKPIPQLRRYLQIERLFEQ